MAVIKPETEVLTKLTLSVKCMEMTLLTLETKTFDLNVIYTLLPGAFFLFLFL